MRHSWATDRCKPPESQSRLPWFAAGEKTGRRTFEEETTMRRIIRPLLGLLVVLAAAAPARAEQIVLIVGGAEKLIYLPVTLADRLGYFREQGLEVELHSEPSGVSAADVLLAGAAHGVVGAYDHAIDLQAKGKSVQSLVQFTIVPGEVLLVASRAADRIRSPADFAGHNLGVTGLGSSTSFLTHYLATLHGVKPADIRLVPVGSGQTFADAMRHGRVDAGMTTEPTASRLIAAGEAKVLVDLRTPEETQKALGGIYPFACLYVSTGWLVRHRAQAQLLANALVKALHFIATHTAAEIADKLPVEFFAGERDSYVQALARSKSMFTPDGVMPPTGPASVLKVLAVADRPVRNKSVDLAQTYTTEFVNAAPSRASSGPSRGSSVGTHCAPSPGADGFAAFGAALMLCRQAARLAAR
jgi:NitT/TauT family transport system substrate-binding protein